MIISKEWYIFLGSVLLSASSLLAEKLETKLSPVQIEPGERAFFDLKLIGSSDNQSEDVTNEFSVADDFLLQHKKIKVLDKTFIKEDGIPTVRYELTAYTSEELRIPPIMVMWEGNQLSTESTIFTVKSVRGEKDSEIRPAFDEVSKPLPYWRFVRLCLLALLTYLSCWLLWPYLQKIPALVPKKRAFQRKENEEDPLLWLKKEWKALKVKKSRERENPELVDDWFRIIKTYFAKKERLTVRTWTTTEFKKNLAKNPKAIEVLPLLASCDRFKFSANNKTSVASLMDEWILETERILLCGN